jgi:hypothetical protein
MLEQLDPEIRRELAAARVAALHRSAMPAQAGPLRRAVASGLVRLGLRLGYDGSVPPLVTQPGYRVGARLEPGTHTVSLGVRLEPDTHTVWFATQIDIERELAAPFGIKVARLRT